MESRIRRRWSHVGLAVMLAAASGASLTANDYYVPVIADLQPIGSNPAANQMDVSQHQAMTERWKKQFQRYVQSYAPDYTDSAWMLGPPKEGRIANPLPIARSGKASAEIVVDLTPALHTPEATLGRKDYPAEVAVMRNTGHVIVGHAADELKHWLDTLSGADIPIVNRPGNAQTRIYVGANFARQQFKADLDKLGAAEALDGFAIRAKGNTVYIFGATSKGTLNGVYAFIENNSDLIWAHGFSDLGTVYTVNPDLRVVWANGLEIPGTIQRGWTGRYSEVDGQPSPFWMWQMRSRCNFIVASGPSPKLADWGCWIEGGGHMLGTAAPVRDKDFFPLIKNPKTGVLAKPDKIEHYQHCICMTHPDLPELYADKMVRDIKRVNAQSPDRPLNAMRLGIEDPGPEKEYGVCYCERCLLPIRLPDGQIIPYQHAAKEGLTFRSTQFYLLLEPIARAMARELPGTRLSTYAYLFTCEAPPFQTSVQPWFCPWGGGGQLSHRDYKNPIFWGEPSWGQNGRWWKRLYEWSRITDLVVLRDYNGLLTNGRPFAEILAWDVRALGEMGVKRFTNETALDTAFLQMDFWVANRIYWNPDADVAALQKYYLRRTFREGAPEMERFFGEIRKWWYKDSKIAREDFVNLGWIIDRMGQKDQLYAHLQRAQELARHPVARANIARLRKTFAIWFHLDQEEATANAMLANAKLGRHVRYSTFQYDGTPLPVSVLQFANDTPIESANLITAADAPSADFSGWTITLRLRPSADAALADFPPPHLSLGNDSAYLPLGHGAVDPGANSLIELDGEAGSYWTPAVASERQKDGSYLYRRRIEKVSGSPFVPAKFSRIRLSYPPGVWRKPPAGSQPEFALFDLQLTDSRGHQYVMPTLATQQGNLARKHYFEGGEMGN